MENLLYQPSYRRLPVPWSILIAATWFLIALAGILHHELWLDEMHHWQLARESNNTAQLFYNIRMEGHPVLWNVCLYVISRFTEDPFFMQLFHIGISTLSCFVFFRYSPFTLAAKVCMACSYFMLYEYTIISRNYALGVLLTWMICTLLTIPVKRFLLIAFMAGMLAQVHLFFLFISVAVFLIAVRAAKASKGKNIPTGMVIIYLPMLLFAVYSIIPANDHFFIAHNSQSLFSVERLGRGLTTFFKAFLHFPDFSRENCWNTNFFLGNFKNLFQYITVLYLFLPLLVFWRKPVSLFLFYFPSLAIALFLYASPLATGIRYYGVVFVAFLMALWLMKENNGLRVSSKSSSLDFESFRKPVVLIFMILLFSTQVIAGFLLFAEDLRRPFSNAEAVAEYIKPKAMNGTIAVSNIAAVSSVSGHLRFPVYSIESHKFLSFSRWNVVHFEFSSIPMVNEMKVCLKMKEEPWLLVSNHPFLFRNDSSVISFSYRDDSLTIRLVKTFRHSMVSTENYFIYRVSR